MVGSFGALTPIRTQFKKSAVDDVDRSMGASAVVDIDDHIRIRTHGRIAARARAASRRGGVEARMYIETLLQF